MNTHAYLQEADKALNTIGALLAKARVGINEPFNPLMAQMSLEYAKVCALAAVAANGAAQLPEAAYEQIEQGPVQQPDPAPTGPKLESNAPLVPGR